MTSLAEVLAELIERMQRRAPWSWITRAVMLACGLVTQIWVSLQGAFGFWTGLGVAAVLLAVIAPRGALPLVGAGFLMLQAAVSDLSPVTMIPVALGLGAWHVSATRLSMGRAWSRQSPAVLRGLRLPSAIGIGAIVLTALAASVVAGASLPDAGVASIALALAVVLGGIVVLWPARDGAGR